MKLPPDITLLHLLAIALIAVAWSGYSTFLTIFGKGSLNAQLSAVRRRWMETSMSRELRMPDAVLLGHMINSVAFFGSATLIVLAGLLGVAANIKDVHRIVYDLPFTSSTSLELSARLRRSGPQEREITPFTVWVWSNRRGTQRPPTRSRTAAIA